MRWDGEQSFVTMIDLSTSGCQISATAELAIGRSCEVHVSGIGWVKGRTIRRSSSGSLGVKLEPTESEEHALIRKLYCSHDYIEVAQEWTVLGALRVIGAWVLR